MKLRIHGNSIRLRLSQSEVAEFAQTGRVESNLEFGEGNRLTYALLADEDISEPEARFQNNSLTVQVPKSRADTWVNSDNVAVTDERSDNRSAPLIIVEKDFTCLHKRAGDGDLDTFPNPNDRS